MTHSFPPRRSADLAMALSTVDGKTQWQTASTVETSSLFGAATPAIAFDTVVVGFSSGELMAMRIENSRPVWQDTLARTGIATSVSMLSDIDASPAIDQGRVFAIGQGGRMAAVELSTGQRVRSEEHTSELQSLMRIS